MTTTTIRLPDELKARVAAVANREGMTAHGFILEAIVEKTLRAERGAELDALAEQRYAQIVSSGESVPWAEMRKYLEALGAGQSSGRPAARKLAR